MKNFKICLQYDTDAVQHSMPAHDMQPLWAEYGFDRSQERQSWHMDAKSPKCIMIFHHLT